MFLYHIEYNGLIKLTRNPRISQCQRRLFSHREVGPTKGRLRPPDPDTATPRVVGVAPDPDTL